LYCGIWWCFFEPSPHCVLTTFKYAMGGSLPGRGWPWRRSVAAPCPPGPTGTIPNERSPIPRPTRLRAQLQLQLGQPPSQLLGWAPSPFPSLPGVGGGGAPSPSPPPRGGGGGGGCPGPQEKPWTPLAGHDEGLQAGPGEVGATGPRNDCLWSNGLHLRKPPIPNPDFVPSYKVAGAH